MKVEHDPKTEALRIVVLEHGFVYVGHARDGGDGYWYIRSALNVRVWGTTRGLGEIASRGPTGATILDMGGHLRAPMSSVVFTLECDTRKWASHVQD